MIIIAKNITDTIEVLNDVGISILPGQSINLMEELSTLSNIVNSKDIISSISKDRIIINNGNTDLSSFCALKYLYAGHLSVEDSSGKTRVHATPRKLGLKTIWLGCGDDPDDPHDIGHGQSIKINHHIGDPLVQTIYVDFNCIDNELYFHDAHLIWENSKYDEIEAEIVTRSTNIIPGTNTNYNLYNDYIIIPANGNGTISLVDDISLHNNGFIYMPNNDLNELPVAFWNATWDTTLKKYVDISPAPYGDGRYNMFAFEIPLVKFIHSVPLLGSSSTKLGSYDSDAIGHGMRLKLTGTTIGEDHDWGMSGLITAYRKKTVYVNGVSRAINMNVPEEPVYKLDENGNFVLVK